MTSVTAARVRLRPLTRVRAVPAWAWLVALVVVSAGVRYAFARRIVAPWIMVDELIYSELAKSFAATGSFALRGEPAGGAYGVVYPILLSPAFRLFDAVPTAYAAAKAINAVLISLAAVPAYFLARRVVSPALAVVAAALTVSVPSVLYAGTLMTENAFYPLFLAAALALVLVLERPTVVRTIVFLAVAAVAFATRAQAAVLVPALLTAPLLLALLDGGRARRLADFRSVYATVAVAAVGVLAVEAARGGSPAGLLGAYRSTAEQDYELGAVARWLVYHVAELDLYVGFLPFAALLLLVALARRLPRHDRVFVAAALALSFWLLLTVAAFASRFPIPPRVEERNAFYVAPLLLIALLVWIERGLPRPPVLAAGAALAAALLPALLPYAALIDVPAQSDTLALLPLWSVHEAFVPLERMWLFVAAVGLALGALFVRVPAPAALALPAIVAAYFVAVVYPIEAGEHGIRRASIGALFQGITTGDRDWIDAAVGPDASVAAIWSGRQDANTIWQNEFFNRSVGAVYVTRAYLPGGLPETRAAMQRSTGRYFAWPGQILQASYVLADERLELDGTRVAADEQKGLVLVRPPVCTHDACRGGREVRGTRLLAGVYDDDWSGPRATYTRYRCRGGTLSVLVDSDPNLFTRPQTVLARVDGRIVARARVRPTGSARLRVPLRRGGAGSCKTTFAVAPTSVPAQVQRGSEDTRRLGVHFRSFDYAP